MKAGDLNRRITLQQRTGGGYGEPVGWVEHAQCWANIKYLSGASSIKSDSVTAVARCSIRVRYRQDVVNGMRVLANGITYNVVSVLPDEAGRVYVDLVCEVTDAGR